MCRALCLFSIFLSLLAAERAHAAACCMSASVAGTGRLVVWEDAAAGFVTSFSHGMGRFDASGTFRAFPSGLEEDELRLDAWGIFRLNERWQASFRVPWVTGLRATPRGDFSMGTGVGDMAAGARFDWVQMGEFQGLPGVAILAQVVGPTGRRPEVATSPLGADATGRGVFSGSLGVALEYATTPWFTRLDAAYVYNAPFVRVDTGKTQTFGPGLQLAFSAGREVGNEKLVLAMTFRFEQEFEGVLEGSRMPDTDSRGLTSLLSASYKLTPHWILQAAASTDALGRLGVGDNREDRLAFNFGIRHGFF